MASSPSEPIPKPISHFLHTSTSHLLSLLPHRNTLPNLSTSNICTPFLFPDTLSSDNAQPSSKSPAALEGVSSSDYRTVFPSAAALPDFYSSQQGGGPAFVGRVFTLCDPSGTGLMAVPTHFEVPFIPKRTPEWLKKMFATITKSEMNGHVFRFFMDLDDAANYVKRINIPGGVIGACRLDIAYEHFKRDPHTFQFVPNEKQVKAANKLLKEVPQNDGRRSIEGVPVFSAQNLDIAIATTDGIKRYTPYFFDKNMLDDVLEKSVDQHYHALIQTRHMQRRQDVIDDNLPAEVMEDMEDNLWEPPEVQEMADEMGHTRIPLSVFSKAAEMELFYALDRVILGNRWLRKATGIQPKFPYMVDSFLKRSTASFLRASESTSYLNNSNTQSHVPSELESKESAEAEKEHKPDFRFPFGDWFSNPFLKHKPQNRKEESSPNWVANLSLPKVTMIGISTGEEQMSKASIKKTMKMLSKQLDENEQGDADDSSNSELNYEDRDPLFVANLGDYSTKSRWVPEDSV